MTDKLQLIDSRTTDVGGIPVARAIPVKERRTIGPWCFLDHIGPARFAPGEPGLNVGPHPHIGLQTFTWMLEGEILHRDSLGSEQVIRPGQVNLMTAGQGIAHTEESVPGHPSVHAAQLWIALPETHQTTRPRFDHYPDLPRWQQHGAWFTLLIGTYQDRQAPTLSFAPILGLDLQADAPCTLTLPLAPEFEHGLLALAGEVTVAGQTLAAEQLAYLAPGASEVIISLSAGARLLLIGGEPLAKPLQIWWNFVSFDKEAIRIAAQDWQSGDPRFGEVAGYVGARLTAPSLAGL
ncbi:pirin family protein [Aeromonas sp. BIGb0445]|uniref:pirin family protein n=1 Tax=Aeromonas sp. BIGb0445 TaxID=2940593 RepID=UPI002167F7BC|nr:pirin family protein [Aeromonas sp. BIGb0445]MCS3458971.1 redox-sensitive bicupin YhaK (pirin superfamily) [Aeromonas sp. BIGb0445]